VTRGPFVIQSQMANSIIFEGSDRTNQDEKNQPLFRFKIEFEYDSRPKAKRDLLKGQTRPINNEFKPCTGSNL